MIEIPSPEVQRAILSGAGFRGRWKVECRDKYGRLKWTDFIDNIVVNQGLDYALDVALSAGAQLASWFVGLTDGLPTVAAGDTLAAHAGWVEVQAYTQATRPAWVDGGVAAQSVDNSASTALFTINAAATTIGGAFLASDSAKGGTVGTLYAAGAFTGGDKVLGNTDALNVTATFTGSST